MAIYRYQPAPHPRVSFQSDFSTRLQPQPGMKVIYARTTIASDREEVKKLAIGYSDDVSVFLNGRILYRGRSAQAFRDPRFLGIVSPENDAVYLPLRKGKNELVLALSELGGGWGFVCRLEKVGQSAGSAQGRAPPGAFTRRRQAPRGPDEQDGAGTRRWRVRHGVQRAGFLEEVGGSGTMQFLLTNGAASASRFLSMTGSSSPPTMRSVGARTWGR